MNIKKVKMKIEVQKLNLNDIDLTLSSRFEEGFLSLKDLPSPSLFKDMTKAVKRIALALKRDEKIVIIGDYDVDGVISTTIFKSFFDSIGANVDWLVPNRFNDGYGLSVNIIPRIKEYDLAITVDNGISSVEASMLCRELDIELIITDHHLVGQTLPLAYAIVNPKQPDCPFPYSDICGAQVIWYLMNALKNELGLNVDMREYLGLVSIAIIADMMPLKHINRAMVIYGLKELFNSTRPAILVFKENIKKSSFNADDIGFFIAPILNSAGRLQDASVAIEFLLSQNISEARENFSYISELNSKRKNIEQELTFQALSMANPEDSVLLINGNGWHEGVIGIVCARVSREFKKPCIILTDSHENGVLKGSGRSFSQCDLHRLTSRCKEHLLKFGGHKSAIGLSLKKENLESLRLALLLSHQEEESVSEPIADDILGEISLEMIDFRLIQLLKIYEPYGMSNSRAKFITRGVMIEDIRVMGKDGEHRKFTFKKDNINQVGILFRSFTQYDKGSCVDVIYTLNENFFNGKTTIQMMIEEILL